MKKDITTHDELVLLVRPMLAKLGHRSVEWAFSRPEANLSINGTCKHCGYELRLQHSLCVQIVKGKKMLNSRWELVVGTYVAAYLNHDTNQLEKIDFERCLCNRLATML